jgi:hypothetical protein
MRQLDVALIIEDELEQAPPGEWLAGIVGETSADRPRSRGIRVAGPGSRRIPGGFGDKCRLLRLGEFGDSASELVEIERPVGGLEAAASGAGCRHSHSKLRARRPRDWELGASSKVSEGVVAGETF